MATFGLITASALAFFLSFVFTPLVRGIAVRWKICEKPNGRTNRDIAHIGGVAIIGAILFTLIPVFLLYLPDDPMNRAFVPILVASGFLTFFLGIIDDLRSLHYLYKLFFQIVVSICVSAGGLLLLEHVGITNLSMPAAVVAFCAAAVWMLGITTSFNLIDGIDGLSSGLALIAAGAFGAAGHLYGQPIVVALSLVLAGAVLAFLRYNFPPAKILMGDSGSLFLGLIFGIISLLLIVPGKDIFFRAAGSVIILSIPLLDTGLAFSRRLATDTPVFKADLFHLHHILLYRFRSAVKVDLFLWGLALVFGLLGILTMRGNLLPLILAVALQVILFTLALRRMIRFELKSETAEEILKSNGINAARMLPRRN
ncbi:MAG TPA: undecaprenyl/decaprenyl-phosphate alpha-N-acetylglucosaminyl 1-phosphate transferase [Candidatus Eisenbacteria bacterium]|uniref:Undecaprenyl/decaprenyl-phosphate alpha-N-acetylglucosaminyl 1-phosphate transferase n=1 Tax=Eiseniibacteriota bacterium TaxID=2212470 RepID=A0A7V2ATP9_UNCEI|nr:undecaprenyl/decaprenyl-phosphate alpha-N-acetylglucosaminyl 1-phosphate transferase [Candidatus Eisenbacteria bacterium]